jgi:adhesin/invasin
MKYFQTWIKICCVAAVALSFNGCGGGGSGQNDNKGGATLSVAASPTSINADSISFSTITATLTDSAGNAASQGTAVIFSTNLGYFANGANSFPTVTNSSGIAVITLYAGTSVGIATVTCSGGGLSQIVNIQFVSVTPGLTANITLSASSSKISADGISTSVITAILTDKNGTAVSVGTPVSFNTSLGVFMNSKTKIDTYTIDSKGTATATLISTLTPGIAKITCTADSGVYAIINIEITSF